MSAEGVRTAFFEAAEKIRSRAPGISLVNRALINRGFSASTIWVARAEALWHMGRKDEAITSLKNALESYPKSLQLHAQLARWLVETGKLDEAKKVLTEAIESHPDSVLPKLYMLVNLKETGEPERVQELYKTYAEQFDVDVFGEEPCWPPGGNRRLHDMWSRDDLHYLLDRLTEPAKAAPAQR
jgi:tetratricopeptide (TPR) repeat protein